MRQVIRSAFSFDIWIAALLACFVAFAGCDDEPSHDASPDGDGDADSDGDGDGDGDADSDGDADGDEETEPLIPSPSVDALMPFWAVLVPVDVNDLPTKHFLVDSGSDRVLVSRSYGDEIVEGQLEELVFAGRTYEGIPCKTHDLERASGLLGVEIAGILGYDLLEDTVLGIDYRLGKVYHLDAWSDDLSFGDHVETPFTTHQMELTSTKMVVATARFEDMDEEVNVIIDTGTTSSVISQSLVDAMGAETDGRTVLRGSKSISPLGEMDTPIIRLRSFEIEGMGARHMWSTIHPDSYFDLVDRVVGVDVEAIVGGGFLREYLVAIDYSDATLHLAPYTSLDHIGDEFTMVGVEVLTTAEGYEIYTVFEGSDAETQGIAVGDALLAIDGESTDDLEHGQIIELLRGEAGTRLSMRLEHEGEAYDVEVLREELLPSFD